MVGSVPIMKGSAGARVLGTLAAGITLPVLMATGTPTTAVPVAAPAVSSGVPVAAAILPTWSAAPALRTSRSSSKPSRILLTPTADPATSQRVSWTMTSRTTAQKVQYRVHGEAAKSVRARRGPATSVKNSGSARPRYWAVLTGLSPGTPYEYRIVTPRGSSTWRTFTTADPAAPSLTMIGLGDTQVDNRGVPRRTVRRALADAPGAQLVLQAGDVVDRPYKGSQWADLFTAMGSAARTRNWVVAIGNHEQCVLVLKCRSKEAQAFRSYFDWPDNGFPEQGETWFHVDYQGVRIVVLDSFGGRMAEQAAFLDKALAENPTKWSIVLMHAPPFATQPGRTNAEVRDLWLPIIERHNVDLVLSGHDHSYVRGYRTINGPVFAVSVSGPKYYEVTDADWVANGARRVIWAAATSTYQVITIAGDTLTYKAVVTDRGTGSTSPFGPGGVLDQFEIVKSADGAKVVR
jgi:Calcineurin-like phosphoesterase/Purple acid Phosphatase, N-terminal domain